MGIKLENILRLSTIVAIALSILALKMSWEIEESRQTYEHQIQQHLSRLGDRIKDLEVKLMGSSAARTVTEAPETPSHQSSEETTETTTP